MSGLPILIILLIAGVAAIGYIVAQKRTKAWEETARRMGFRFTGGGLMQSRSLSGRIDGVFVKAHEFTRGSGKNRTRYTGYRAQINGELPSGFHLKKQGFFSGFAKFFGSQDIEIGDQRFDDKVLIKGRQANQIAAFLTPSRRMRILSLMQRYTECEIDSGGVFVALRGSASDPAILEAHVRRAVEVARFLSEKPAERRRFDEAIEEREQQAPEVALQAVNEVNQTDAKPDTDALEMEGELLYLGGQYAEAAEKFSEARTAQPANDDLDAWIETCLKRQPEVEPALQPEPQPEPIVSKLVAAEPAPTFADVPTGSNEVDFEQLCGAVFIATSSRFEATRLFEKEFEGKTVHWTGLVQAVTDYSYDLVFKSGPGLIAQIELKKLENHPYGIRSITAAVQLPKDDALKAELEVAAGQAVAFSGTLKKCDAFNGTLYLERGACT